MSFFLAENARWNFGVPERANITHLLRAIFLDILVDISGSDHLNSGLSRTIMHIPHISKLFAI